MPRPAFGIANVLAEGIWQPLGDTKVWSKTYRVKQGPCCAFIGLAAADGTYRTGAIAPSRRRTSLPCTEVNLAGSGFRRAIWRDLYSQDIQASFWQIESLQGDWLFDAAPGILYIRCLVLLHNVGRRWFAPRRGMASVGGWIVAGRFGGWLGLWLCVFGLVS